MTIEITIQVPDTLGRQLQQLQGRLPEVLERGLREILAVPFRVIAQGVASATVGPGDQSPLPGFLAGDDHPQPGQ